MVARLTLPRLKEISTIQPDFFCMKSKFLSQISNNFPGENIYEKIVIISKRARQILEHRQEAFSAELQKMGIAEPSENQLINVNGWQAILAKTYEAKENPIFCAQKELEDKALAYTHVSDDNS